MGKPRIMVDVVCDDVDEGVWAPPSTPAAIATRAASRTSASFIHPFTYYVIAAVLQLACDEGNCILGPLGEAARAIPLLPLWFIHDVVCQHHCPEIFVASLGILLFGARFTKIRYQGDALVLKVYSVVALFGLVF